MESKALKMEDEDQLDQFSKQCTTWDLTPDELDILYIKKAIKNTPNDQKLGEKIRKYFQKKKFHNFKD